MGYLDDETSASDGAPVELYEFTGAVATYRYTSGPLTVTYGGNDFTPVAGLERGGIAHATDSASAALEVRISSASALAQAYISGAPPTSLRLKIYRRQATSGEVAVVWHADVVSVSAAGAVATLRTSSLVGRALETQIPSIIVRPMCGHVLYSERCGVNRSAYAHATTVSAVSGTSITIASAGGNPDGWFASGGEIERTSDGQRRTVVSHAGAVVTLLAPFSTLAPGDAVTLWPGCDHTFGLTTSVPQVPYGHCHSRFNNVVNYGGHPYVPASNPFIDLVRIRR